MKKFTSIEEIKEERKNQRNNEIVYTLLGTILGELDRLPIPRTEQPKEGDIYKVIKKLYEASKETNNLKEQEFLEDYIIKLLSEDELSNIIKEISVQLQSENKNPNIGLIMKGLQIKYPNAYDGKVASRIIKEMFS